MRLDAQLIAILLSSVIHAAGRRYSNTEDVEEELRRTREQLEWARR